MAAGREGARATDGKSGGGRAGTSASPCLSSSDATTPGPVQALRTLAAALLAVALLLGKPAFGAESPCRGDIALSDGYTIRSLKVKARWGLTPKLQLPIAAGQTFDPAQLSQAVAAVQQAVEKASGEGIGLQEAFAVSWVTTCVRADDASKTVEVEIEPATLTSNLKQELLNLLPLARSSLPTFYSEIAKPLLALNPRFGIQRDETYGPAFKFNLSSNASKLAALAADQPSSAGPSGLAFELVGTKSLNERHYNSSGQLKYVGRTGVGQWGLYASYQADREPVLEAARHQNSAAAGGFGELNFSGPISSAHWKAAYRRSSNRLQGTGLEEAGPLDTLEARGLLNGTPAGWAFRAGVWLDHNLPQDGGNFQRLAAAAALHKEFALRPNQSIGLEAVVSAGRSWGVTPQFARFYGGPALQDFLYLAEDSTELAAVPPGPVLRSFGRGQAGLPTPTSGSVGATSFFGFSLNVSLPIPPWSRPLIPDIVVNENPRKTIRDVLKAQVRNSEFFLAENLQSQGRTPQQAQAEAKQILAQLEPVVNYLADQANLFSLRPLFLLDAARMNAPEAPSAAWRSSIGAGLELTVVVARFEIGYLRAVQRLAGDGRDGVYARLVIDNLF